MCEKILTTLLLTLNFSMGVAAEPTTSQNENVSAVVEHIMKTLESGNLLVLPQPNEASLSDGWVMPFHGGKEIKRSELNLQCSAITPYGWHAVPELLKWLDHKDSYMRYMSAHSLEIITGLHPTFYYFGKPYELFNDDPNWFTAAKRTWAEWYEKLLKFKQKNT